jgi:hypothetical protein
VREACGIQRLADHAGRREIDVLRPAFHGLGREVCGNGYGFTALTAGEGVSVAGIDDEGARRAVLEILPAP